MTGNPVSAAPWRTEQGRWLTYRDGERPAHAGLFGRPTVINNVLSLASVPIVLAQGAAHYRDFGIGRSRGTMHEAIISAEPWPDDVPVPTFGPRMVCTRCGICHLRTTG